MWKAAAHAACWSKLNAARGNDALARQCLSRVRDLEERTADPVDPELFDQLIDQMVAPLARKPLFAWLSNIVTERVQRAKSSNADLWFSGVGAANPAQAAAERASAAAAAAVAVAEKANEHLRYKLIQDYKDICNLERSTLEHSAYLQYQNILNAAEEVAQLFILKHRNSPNMYKQFDELRQEVQRIQLQQRDLIFGAEFVDRVMKQLTDREKNTNNYKRCPSYRTPWWDDGGCSHRRCGHQGAPGTEDYVEVPKRGKLGKQSGCGKKFEWNFGVPLTYDEFVSFWKIAPPRWQTCNGKNKKRLLDTFGRNRSRSPRRLDKTSSATRADLVQVKQESPEELHVVHELPTSSGWDIELQYMPTGRNKIITTFIESDPTMNDAKCFLPGTHFLRADGSVVAVEQINEGGALQGPMGRVIVEDIVAHSEEVRGIVTVQLDQVGFTVTADHRMCLQGGIFKAAQELNKNDILSTTMGDQRIIDLQRSTRTVAVFALAFRGDRPVFVGSMEGGDLQVAAFGSHVRIDENVYMHFKFKGPICEETHSRFSAEKWLEEHSGVLSQFDMQFLATDPYSVWVVRDHADKFYSDMKQLLSSHAPRGSRVRRCRPRPLIPPQPEGIQTPPQLTP